MTHDFALYETTDHYERQNELELERMAQELMSNRYKLNRYYALWLNDIKDLPKSEQRKAFKAAWLTK